ncbi:PLP-dependent aminotransferase family protein [Phycicoccus avicenniae]|uniref:MocR-like pyridoxine biosynthesis transcription factor PdxR n=1 Tax=Phycicoccus avicenniae TaxID=2828860 RepID=UPI003D2CF5B7
MARSPRAVDVPLVLDDSPAPLRHRVADAVVGALRTGRLRPGDTLPSTRSLAAALGVSRGPVVAAYDELAAAGFLRSRAGSGAVVAPGADTAARAGAATHVPETGRVRPPSPEPVPAAPRLDLRPGRPDTSLLDRAAWRRAWRAVGDALPGNDAGEVPRHTHLRRVLADHLRRGRGVVVDPDDLFVVPGVGASLRALPEAFGLVGASVALEDPGYVEAWTAFAAEGVRTHPVPVDADGLDPALLPDGARAVYVTPSHQYPLGARMPVTRRVALLEWARDTGGLVLEDDYDGEFRYDVSPLPALRSLPGAEDHVVYVGTASKLLAPSLRVAWVAAPAHLRDALRVTLESRGLVVNEATGLALAELVTSGALAAHHARASRTYAARRGALVTAVAEHLPGATLEGVDAGLHVVLRLPDDVDDHEVADRCHAAGVAVSPLSAYAVRTSVRGLVLCYAGLPETAADDAVRRLARALAP